MLNGFLELAEEQEIISFDWQSFSSNWSATAAFVLPVKNARQRSNNSSFSDLIIEQGGRGEAIVRLMPLTLAQNLSRIKRIFIRRLHLSITNVSLPLEDSSNR